MPKGHERIVYGYIADGQTARARIPALEDVYPEVKLTYRQLQLIPQQRLLFSLGETLKSVGAVDKLQKTYALFICQQVIEWDLHRNRDELVDLDDPDDVLRIQPNLFERLIQGITCRKPFDVIHDDTATLDIAGENSPSAILQSALNGETIEETITGN